MSFNGISWFQAGNISPTMLRELADEIEDGAMTMLCVSATDSWAGASIVESCDIKLRAYRQQPVKVSANVEQLTKDQEQVLNELKRILARNGYPLR